MSLVKCHTPLDVKLHWAQRSENTPALSPWTNFKLGLPLMNLAEILTRGTSLLSLTVIGELSPEER